MLIGSIISELHLHGDNHSFYMQPSMTKQFAETDLMGRGREVVLKYLGNGIGYLSMPGFGSMNDSIRIQFSTSAQAAIKKIDTETNICAWVVDLRYDDGGSCPPMIAGLGPILGEGAFSRDFAYTSKGDTGISYYRNGECYFELNGIKDSLSTKVLHPYRLRNDKAPVAVLIGKGCGSSGECAVAAFIGRPNTRLFGQPTAGLTKGNEDFTLPDNSMLFIAAGIQTDRNGKKYPERIFPDTLIDDTKTDKSDLTLDKAKEWLLSLSECK